MTVEPSKISGRLIAATALASALSPLNSTMLSVSIGPIGAALHQSQTVVTRALVTSYLVTSIVMQAPGGKLGDRLGHRRAVALGQIAFAVGAVLALVAPTLAWVVVARVLMASAGALIVPSATALLRTELPAELRGRAFGAFGASMALAAALGPVIGGQLTTLLGWRAVFAVNLVVLPVSAVLAGDPRAPSHERAAPPEPFDVAGALLLGASLAAFVIGSGRDAASLRWLLLVAPAFLVLFVLVEQRHRAPVVDLALLRIRTFVTGGVLIGLHNLAMYSLLFELPSVARTLVDAGAGRSGALLAAVMAPMVVFGPIAGRLTDSHGPRAVALVGTALALAGMAILIVTPLQSLVSQVPGLLVFGTGIGLASAPSQSAAMTAIPANRSGVAAGMMATMRYLGGVVGTLLLGMLPANGSDREATLAAHHRLLSVFAGALVCAVVCAATLPNRRAGAPASA